MRLINKIKGFFKPDYILYSSDLCSDCQKAESFFKNQNFDIEVKKIEESEYRQELKEKYGKVLVPTIILGNKKFIGFENNQEKIKKKLGLI